MPLRESSLVRILIQPLPILLQHLLHELQALLTLGMHPPQLGDNLTHFLGQLDGVGSMALLERDIVLVRPAFRVVLRRQRRVWRDADVGVVERLVLIAEDDELLLRVRVRGFDVCHSAPGLQDGGH